MAANDLVKETKQDWDDLTDSFIEGIDKTILKDSSFKLRNMLLNPTSYISKASASESLKKAKDAVEEYFSSVLLAFSSDKEKLDKELESSSVNFAKISSIIIEKATSLDIPFIKPYSLEITENNRESIIVEKYDPSIELFIGKLLSKSKYIADISGKYRGHTLGSWVFSSDRAYILTIKPPESIILDIENSKDIILFRLEEFSNQLELFKTSK